MDGKIITAMAYIMTPGKEYGTPSQMYLDTISCGYTDFGFDLSVLHQAVELNAKRITSASSIIFKWSEKQEKQFISACPRCGICSMNNPMHHNALSRRADVYICDECGMGEAIKDMLGEPDPIDEWYAVREYLKKKNSSVSFYRNGAVYHINNLSTAYRTSIFFRYKLSQPKYTRCYLRSFLSAEY